MESVQETLLAGVRASRKPAVAAIASPVTRQGRVTLSLNRAAAPEVRRRPAKGARWTAWALLLLAGGGSLQAQTTVDLTRQARLGTGSALPAQCAVGQVFFKSNAAAGANLYTCTSANVWTPAGLIPLGGDASGTAPSTTITGLQGRPVSGANPADQDALRWNAAAGQWTPQAVVATGSGTPPVACSTGGLYLRNDTASNIQQLYVCSNTNTWKMTNIQTGAAAGRPANCAAGQTWLAIDTGAMTYCSVAGSPGTWSATLAGPPGPQGAAGATGPAGPIAGSNGQLTYNSSGAAAGSNLTQNSDGSLTANKGFNPPVCAVALSSSPAFDASQCNAFALGLGATAVASSSLTNAKPGQFLTFIVTQDATGGRSFAWPSNLLRGCGVSGTPGVSTIVTAVYDGVNANAIDCTTGDSATVISGPERAEVDTTPAGSAALSFSSNAHTGVYFGNNSANRHIMPRTAGSTDQLASSDLSDGSNLMTLNQTNAVTGYLNALNGILRMPEATVSGLPPAASSTGKIFVVTDAAGAGSCTSGGASNQALCRSNGTAWAPLGDGWGSLPSTVVQTNQSNSYSSGAQDFSGAGHTIPAKAGSAANKPATCTSGEMYFATDATAGQNWYYCTAANTWTQQLNSGGGSAGVTLSAGKGYVCLFEPCKGAMGGWAATVNVSYYGQFVLRDTTTVKQYLQFVNPGNSSTHMVWAIMDSNCNKISGSDARISVGAGGQYTVGATTSSPPTLTPGVYYLAWGSDDTTGQYTWQGTWSAGYNFFFYGPYDSPQNSGSAPRFFSGAALTGSGATLAIPSSCGTKTLMVEQYAPTTYIVP